MIFLSTQNFPPELGGIQNYMYEVAAGLHQRDWSIYVLADQSHQDAKDFDAALGFQIQRFGGLKMLRRRNKARQLARLAKQSQGNTILFDTWKSLEYLPAKIAANNKTVCFAHGMEFSLDFSAKKQTRIRQSLAKADLVLAVSHFTADRVKPFLSANTQLVLSPPGVSDFGEPDNAIVEQITQQHGKGSPTLLTIGRLEPRKSQDKIITAVAKLRATYPDIQYFIIGDGEDRPRLESLVETLSLEQQVTFLGRVSDQEKMAWLAQADLFAMPSRAEGASVEGFGIVFLEAAYFGTPSLAGLEGGARDAVLDGETGVLCDGADDEAVLRGLQTLLAPDNLASFGANAKSRAHSAFLWPRILAKLESHLSQ